MPAGFERGSPGAPTNYVMPYCFYDNKLIRRALGGPKRERCKMCATSRKGGTWTLRRKLMPQAQL